ncbi:hypothetical protein DL93DRAFT_2073842 [Clavulina sp. PMI_390]|nr:hypothetical protein DL93DRAFT_2073842 [Clavulina sp. PMI_390]
MSDLQKSEEASELPSYDTLHISTAAAGTPPAYDTPPQPASPSSLTTHTYTINPQPNTIATLTLTTSHSPSPDKLALFFLGDTVRGEFQLVLKKQASIRKISVYIEGQYLTTGSRRLVITPGAPGGYNIFWDSPAPNLLPTSNGGEGNGTDTAVTFGAGNHTFPFSITIPKTYTPKAQTAGPSTEKSNGTLSGWARSLFGGKGKGKEKEEVPSQETAPATSDSATAESTPKPLPSTTLSHQQKYDVPYVNQYVIWASVEAGPLHDDYKFSKQIVVLARKQSVASGSSPSPALNL